MTSKVLTDLQAKVLKILFESGIGKMGYYLTGGTALAEFYLQHRYSDDLDLFTRENRSPKEDYQKLSKLLLEHDLQITPSEVADEFVRLSVSTVGGQEHPLQVELARDVPVIISPASTYNKIVVDSFEDIAVNKISCILLREPPEPKDFVDLFFILENSRYSIDYLLSQAKQKEAALDGEYGTLQFAANLVRVQELQSLSKIRMIKPLNMEQLRSRLSQIAHDILLRFRPKKR